MFGAICAGRLVQTNLQQVDQNKFVFQLLNAETINHVTVFLLPESKWSSIIYPGYLNLAKPFFDPFPENYGATVFFSWPGKDFQLLGGLSNAKPSAIFRLGGSHGTSGMQGVVASLGISVEQLPAVDAQLATLPKNGSASAVSMAVAAAAPSAAVLTTRIVSNLYNFLTGYAVDANQLSPTEQFVPLRAFQEWHTKFTKRLQLEPTFLDKDQE